jgi:hypothetical protein
VNIVHIRATSGNNIHAMPLRFVCMQNHMDSDPFNLEGHKTKVYDYIVKYFLQHKHGTACRIRVDDLFPYSQQPVARQSPEPDESFSYPLT